MIHILNSLIQKSLSMNVRLSSCGSVSSCTDKDMRGIRLLSLSGGSPKSQHKNKNTQDGSCNILPNFNPRIRSRFSIQVWEICEIPLCKNMKKP